MEHVETVSIIQNQFTIQQHKSLPDVNISKSLYQLYLFHLLLQFLYLLYLVHLVLLGLQMAYVEIVQNIHICIPVVCVSQKFVMLEKF